MNAHILVVDDVPRNVKLLADVLAAKGYRTSTAASGEEALAAIAVEPPDLVLLDVMMPGLSGYDVCRAIRADPKLAMLPVVLVTALDPAKERITGLEAGADDFLGKPIQQAELMARVRRCCWCATDRRRARHSSCWARPTHRRRPLQRRYRHWPAASAARSSSWWWASPAPLARANAGRRGWPASWPPTAWRSSSSTCRAMANGCASNLPGCGPAWWRWPARRH